MRPRFVGGHADNVGCLMPETPTCRGVPGHHCMPIAVAGKHVDGWQHRPDAGADLGEAPGTPTRAVLRVHPAGDNGDRDVQGRAVRLARHARPEQPPPCACCRTAMHRALTDVQAIDLGVPTKLERDAHAATCRDVSGGRAASVVATGSTMSTLSDWHIGHASPNAGVRPGRSRKNSERGPWRSQLRQCAWSRDMHFSLHDESQGWLLTAVCACAARCAR